MALKHRYDFVMLFDVENGNPNGDPDMGNNPRVDAETNYGYITDVCLKRKVRNYVELVKKGAKGYRILIKPERPLNDKFKDAYIEEALETEDKTKITKEDELKARDYMCRNYYDVRTFGAVMSTGDNPCGIVRGPVQINFAKSQSRVNVQDICITRQARTSTERHEKAGETEIGRKSFIPYALYRAEGYISAPLANKTGFSEEDAELLWTALINMFENDHSAARGKMCMRRLYVFEHECEFGNCPSHVLFDKIQVKEDRDKLLIHDGREGTDKESCWPPRAFSDYIVTVDEKMPAGVSLIRKL